MSIIYEQTPGGLYPTGQRTVTTFPSGLIRVDQSFACKITAAATHRATLAVGANFPGDSYPAMDGLKIFPEPQEKRRDDGFTEFAVSGFGRSNATGRTTFEFKFFSETAYKWLQPSANVWKQETKKVALKNRIKKIQKVIPTSEVGSFNPDLTGATTPQSVGDLDGYSLWYYDIAAQDIKSQQYGYFTEFSYVVDALKSDMPKNEGLIS